MGAPAFWDNNERAQKHIAKLNTLKRAILPVIAFQKKVDDTDVMLELLGLSDGGEREVHERELLASVAVMADELDKLEIASFLTGQFDKNNAFLSIQAGITKATLFLKGENAYGYAKAERGVHRLVRISPFDSNKRRHTSFCAVDVIAEITEDIDIAIPESDIRVDVYRSSGKGGQGVNTTDSAVRVTHIPSGIVVVCQNERSQIKNRASAMSVLKARLYEKRLDEQRSEMERFYGEKGEIGWGSQIRSYVLQPYQMVKDLRTGYSTSDTQGVLDGELDKFITAWLRAGSPRHRNKDIQIDD